MTVGNTYRVNVQVTGSSYSKVVCQPMDELPLEVVTLLNVFSRIEARRQARLRNVQRKVS